MKRYVTKKGRIKCSSEEKDTKFSRIMVRFRVRNVGGKPCVLTTEQRREMSSLRALGVKDESALLDLVVLRSTYNLLLEQRMQLGLKRFRSNEWDLLLGDIEDEMRRLKAPVLIRREYMLCRECGHMFEVTGSHTSRMAYDHCGQHHGGEPILCIDREELSLLKNRK